MDHKLGEAMDNMMKKSDPNYKDNPDIKWNFTKFFIDKKGNVVARFEPTADGNKMAPEIEKLLK